MIALIGDHDRAVTAHRAIPRALALGADEMGIEVDPIWVDTESIERDAAERRSSFSGIWCVPASPYRSTDGALGAIRLARETGDVAGSRTTRSTAEESHACPRTTLGRAG